MENKILLEEKLYEQLKEKFTNPCEPEIIKKVYSELYTIREVCVGKCTLFDLVRIYYRHFESVDKTKKVFIVIAQFDSSQFPKMQSCFPNAYEAKEFFNSLKKEFCEI